VEAKASTALKICAAADELGAASVDGSFLQCCNPHTIRIGASCDVGAGIERPLPRQRPVEARHRCCSSI
jgi:hypothetical protein